MNRSTFGNRTDFIIALMREGSERVPVEWPKEVYTGRKIAQIISIRVKYTLIENDI